MMFLEFKKIFNSIKILEFQPSTYFRISNWNSECTTEDMIINFLNMTPKYKYIIIPTSKLNTDKVGWLEFFKGKKWREIARLPVSKSKQTVIAYKSWPIRRVPVGPASSGLQHTVTKLLFTFCRQQSRIPRSV